MNNDGASARWSPKAYGRLLLFVAGLGGLLYGIDIGIISAALLYLGKAVDLTQGQTSAIVAAVLGGSMISSLAAGFLADWVGRKTMMVVSGALFVLSVVLIVLSHGFTTLLMGRLLQGLSGGVIAVVVPLYLAECLSPQTRGRGSAIFQFMLTFGIVAAALVGLYYIHGAESAIAAAKGDLPLIRAAEDHAWRGMFLTVIYPGMAFVVGSLFLSETPRWFFQKGRDQDAYRALLRSSSETEATRELAEMRQVGDAGAGSVGASTSGSLLQRRYVIPFALTCVILVCNQGTGINSVLAYLSVILQQAGMTAQHAAGGDLAVKTLNCVMTIVAIGLIDRKGRKLLLSVGTGGIVLALLFEAAVFHHVEASRTDVQREIVGAVERGHGVLGPADVRALAPNAETPVALRALYTHGDGDRLVTIFSNADPREVVDLRANGNGSASGVEIRRALLFPVPPERTGWWITIGLGVFIAFYSVGPGVVVWLTLSELMPTRIRSGGMGIALLLNQGASTAIAGVFLPVVSRYGYDAIFAAWAASTCFYFLAAVYFLPETKGKTLEEIEMFFARGHGATGR